MELSRGSGWWRATHALTLSLKGRRDRLRLQAGVFGEVEHEVHVLDCCA